jgi:hypothetical protein
MKRVADMTLRLPFLYREGPLVEGILSQPAEQIEIAVEDALEVQRAHFFDDAVGLDEVARLASLLDFAPEAWQTLRLFRSWVHAQRDAVLLNGGVTIEALQGFADSYTAAYQSATGNAFASTSGRLFEFPQKRRYATPGVNDDIAPLSRFSITNKGLFDTWVSFLFTGLADGPESMPLIANLSTGDALLFHGNIEPGQRLWIRSAADGSVMAQLEREDVTAKLVSISGLTPGTPWQALQVKSPPKALPLQRGDNSLWFVPVAHFDERGLDRFLLALADLALAEGRWDAATLDHSIFYQDPAVKMRLTWLENEPASFELQVEAQSVRRKSPSPGTPEDARDQIVLALDTGLKRLKAAGVRGQVSALAFTEVQPAHEFVTGVLPLHLKEAGSGGGDSLSDNGGKFGFTNFGDSTYR